MLDVADVHKSYGRRVALDGVNLGVAPGEVLGLLGPNGAGKTTLVSIVAGLRHPDAGRVTVGGLDAVTHPQEARCLIGLAPQNTGVYEALTVRENLRFFGELVGLRRREVTARIDELGVALRLDTLMSRPAYELSGGEKRRLHTAIAFVHRPPLLLLDEPTVGADIETRSALLDIVRALADDGSAIVYSTHYLPEVDALRASVAILEHGRVIASGRVDELVTRFGAAVAELTFDGPAPPCPPCVVDHGSVTRDGSTLRITARDPAAAAAAVISRLGDDTTRLCGVELLRPSLDSVFLALTGRRYGGSEVGDVVAA